MVKTRFRRKPHSKKNKSVRRNKKLSRRVRGGMPKKACDPRLFVILKNDGELSEMIDEKPSCNKLWTIDSHGNETEVDLRAVKSQLEFHQTNNPKNWGASNAVIHRHSDTNQYQLTQCC